MEQTDSFSREGFDGHVYIEKEAALGFNALLIDVHGRHPRKRMIDTTRTYFVVDGSGTFDLNGQVTEVKKGDFVVIPAGSEYEYQGQMQLFEVNISATNTFQDERLEP